MNASLLVCITSLTPSMNNFSSVKVVAVLYLESIKCLIKILMSVSQYYLT